MKIQYRLYNSKKSRILKHNREVLAGEKSNFSAINTCAGEIVHCMACKGSYAKTFFFRHQANCRVNTQKDHNPAASPQATPDTGNTDDSFNDILVSFHRDDIGIMCRNNPTIKTIGKMLWNKDSFSNFIGFVDFCSVMASMRNLAKLFIEFKNQLECVDETTEASLMFDRMHWASLSEAIKMSREATMTASSSTD